MNDLGDLKKLFESNKIKVTEFDGHQLKTSKGETWTLALGVYYKNNTPVDEKQLVDSFKPEPKRRRKK